MTAHLIRNRKGKLRRLTFVRAAVRDAIWAEPEVFILAARVPDQALGVREAAQ